MGHEHEAKNLTPCNRVTAGPDRGEQSRGGATTVAIAVAQEI